MVLLLETLERVNRPLEAGIRAGGGFKMMPLGCCRLGAALSSSDGSAEVCAQVGKTGKEGETCGMNDQGGEICEVKEWVGETGGVNEQGKTGLYRKVRWVRTILHTFGGRGGESNSLHWLLKEPLVHDGRLDVCSSA